MNLARTADRFNAAEPDSVASGGEVLVVMAEMGRRARAAARRLGLATGAEKDAALKAMAVAIRASAEAILAANAEDVAEAKSKDQTGAFIDRLTLDARRVEGIAAAVESIAALLDPVLLVLVTFERPNGIVMEQ